MAEVKTISSNVSRLSIRRDGAADWLTVKPVGFADFGVEIEKEDNLVIEARPESGKADCGRCLGTWRHEAEFHAGILRSVRR